MQKADNLRDRDDSEGRVLDLTGISFKSSSRTSLDTFVLKPTTTPPRAMGKCKRTAWSKTWMIGRSARVMNKFWCRPYSVSCSLEQDSTCDLGCHNSHCIIYQHINSKVYYRNTCRRDSFHDPYEFEVHRLGEWPCQWYLPPQIG